MGTVIKAIGALGIMGGILFLIEAGSIIGSGDFDPGDTKNVPSTRDIEVTERVISLLKKHRNEQNKYMAATGTRNPLGLVFPDLPFPLPDENKAKDRPSSRRKKAQKEESKPTAPQIVELDYMNRKNLTGRFTNLANKLGHSGFTFHGLRHSHATILLSRGWYIVDVSERLGHADVDTTLNTYAHCIPKRKAETAKKFDEIMDGKV